MKVDNAFQTMVGVERPAAGKCRSVALDTQPELHDRVDLWVPSHQVEELGNGVPGLATGQVDRVVATPTWRKHPIDSSQQVVGQRGEVQVSVGAHRVGGHYSPSSGRAQHYHATTVRQGLGSKRSRRLERRLDGGSPD